MPQSLRTKSDNTNFDVSFLVALFTFYPYNQHLITPSVGGLLYSRFKRGNVFLT